MAMVSVIFVFMGAFAVSPSVCISETTQIAKLEVVASQTTVATKLRSPKHRQRPITSPTTISPLYASKDSQIRCRTTW
jgi:hypothetical protein